MWGRNIARNLNALGLLAGVADRSAAAADEFAAQFATKSMTVAETIADADIDAVAIVTAARPMPKLPSLHLMRARLSLLKSRWRSILMKLRPWLLRHAAMIAF